MSAFRPAACLLLTSLASLSLVALLRIPAAAEERLTNGGFEAGLAGWTSLGVSTSGCPPQAGSAAAALAPTPAQSAFLQQNVTVAGGGSYTLRLQVALLSGSGEAQASVAWRDADGNQVSSFSANLSLGAGYAAFEAGVTAPSAARTALVRIMATATGASAVVCLDSVSFDGPPPSTPSPSATATPPASATPALTATTAPSTATVTAIATAVSPSSTPTRTPTMPATRTPTPPPSRGLTFVNGGFEEGLAGWEKFGGELSLSLQARSGAAAGLLTSATSSTKWAYQAVAIEPASAYEFSGYVRAGAGVREAYLRVSFYESADGSGSAITTVDSTGRTGRTDGYVFLTTGPFRPPSEARSARLRVLLAPEGGGAATLHMDDFAFGPAVLPAAATPLPRAATPVSEEDGVATPTAAGATRGPAAGTTATSTPRPSRTAEVRPAAQQRAASTPTAEPAARQSEAGGDLGLTAGLAIVGLSLVLAAGAYLYSRRPGGARRA